MGNHSDEISAGDIQDLAVAVEQLSEETKFLRISLDELRDDVVWAARQTLATGYQISGTPPPPPRDPLTPGIPIVAPNVNEQAPTIEHAMDHRAESTGMGPYCCDRPNLRWNGDPDLRSVACENCGYVIADQGSVVIWREKGDELAIHQAQKNTDARPTERQAGLFD